MACTRSSSSDQIEEDDCDYPHCGEECSEVCTVAGTGMRWHNDSAPGLLCDQSKAYPPKEADESSS